MKQQDLNKKSDKNLIRLKKELEIELIKASCNWSSEKAKSKEAGITSNRGGAQKVIRTSLTKQLRRTIAQINNTLSQRGLYEEACRGKPESKRRKRRLRGRMKNER